MTDMPTKLVWPAKAMIGMVHVPALPGTAAASLTVDEIVNHSVAEATAIASSGFDAVLIENMHDRPYLLGAVGPEITAAMTAVVCAIRGVVDLPLGVQVLAGANREALAVALAGGADFIRAEGFVFSHVADEGQFTTADAGPLLRYRRAIGAERVAVIADVKKKHASHALTADVDLADTARAAQFFGADGVVITGTSTGRPADPDDVRHAKGTVDIPVIVGSGVNPEDLPALWPHADAFIVGSYIKRDGDWRNPLDPRRIDALLAGARSLAAK